MRGEYTNAIYYGLDRRLAIPNQLPNRTNDPWLIYYLQGNKFFVANYKSIIHQFSVQPVYSINIHRLKVQDPKAYLYVLGGYSLLVANVNVDALDANGKPYDFSSPNSPVNFESGSQKQIRKQLKEYIDLNYESNAGIKNGNSSKSNNIILRHSIQAGGGYTIKLNRHYSVALEHKITYAFSDELDGISKGPRNDMLHFSSLRFNVNIHSRKVRKYQPITQANPDYHVSPETTVRVDSIAKNEKEIIHPKMIDTLTTLAVERPSNFPIDSIFHLRKSNYEFNEATLTKDAKIELDSLVNILNWYPTMVIEIRSHTDSKGTHEYNIDLSNRRAKSCVDYLISKKIDSSRLMSIGFGATLPIAPNTFKDGSDNPEGRSRNRRTEFKVIRQ